MGKSHFLRSLTPKKNIVECLECGHWHEAHTICGIKIDSQIFEIKTTDFILFNYIHLDSF